MNTGQCKFREKCYYSHPNIAPKIGIRQGQILVLEDQQATLDEAVRDRSHLHRTPWHSTRDSRDLDREWQQDSDRDRDRAHWNWERDRGRDRGWEGVRGHERDRDRERDREWGWGRERGRDEHVATVREERERSLLDGRDHPRRRGWDRSQSPSCQRTVKNRAGDFNRDSFRSGSAPPSPTPPVQLRKSSKEHVVEDCRNDLEASSQGTCRKRVRCSTRSPSPVMPGATASAGASVGRSDRLAVPPLLSNQDQDTGDSHAVPPSGRLPSNNNTAAISTARAAEQSSRLEDASHLPTPQQQQPQPPPSRLLQDARTIEAKRGSTITVQQPPPLVAAAAAGDAGEKRRRLSDAQNLQLHSHAHVHVHDQSLRESLEVSVHPVNSGRTGTHQDLTTEELELSRSPRPPHQPQWQPRSNNRELAGDAVGSSVPSLSNRLTLLQAGIAVRDAHDWPRDTAHAANKATLMPPIPVPPTPSRWPESSAVPSSAGGGIVEALGGKSTVSQASAFPAGLASVEAAHAIANAQPPLSRRSLALPPGLSKVLPSEPRLQRSDAVGARQPLGDVVVRRNSVASGDDLSEYRRLVQEQTSTRAGGVECIKSTQDRQGHQVQTELPGAGSLQKEQGPATSSAMIPRSATGYDGRLHSSAGEEVVPLEGEGALPMTVATVADDAGLLERLNEIPPLPDVEWLTEETRAALAPHWESYCTTAHAQLRQAASAVLKLQEVSRQEKQALADVQVCVFLSDHVLYVHVCFCAAVRLHVWVWLGPDPVIADITVF
jgi:hypothetical protein